MLTGWLLLFISYNPTGGIFPKDKSDLTINFLFSKYVLQEQSWSGLCTPFQHFLFHMACLVFMFLLQLYLCFFVCLENIFPPPLPCTPSHRQLLLVLQNPMLQEAFVNTLPPLSSRDFFCPSIAPHGSSYCCLYLCIMICLFIWSINLLVEPEFCEIRNWLIPIQLWSIGDAQIVCLPWQKRWLSLMDDRVNTIQTMI